MRPYSTSMSKTFIRRLQLAVAGALLSSIALTGCGDSLGPATPRPTAADDSVSTPWNVPATVRVLGNDTSPDGGALHVDTVFAPGLGEIIRMGDSITYVARAGYTGSDSFRYVASDAAGRKDTASVTVRVRPGAYHVIQISDDGEAAAVNDLGEVLFNRWVTGVGSNGVLWRSGTLTRLGDRFFGTAINNHSVVAGYAGRGSFGIVAAVWRAGRVEILPVTDSSNSSATGINDRGDVVGNVHGGLKGRANLWTEDGTRIDLGFDGTPAAINERREIVGGPFDTDNRAFFWKDGHFTILIDSRQAMAPGINNAGTIVGSDHINTADWLAFQWKDGRLTYLPVPEGDPPNSSMAVNINDAGQIVGRAGGNGVIWSAGGAADLNQLIDTDYYWNVMPVDINNHGQILVRGRHGKDAVYPPLLLDPIQ